MVLFQIPDIRLFWSSDPRFLKQFKADTITSFKPYSKYPDSWKDISFWIGERDIHENDVHDIVRDIAGELAEEVKQVSGSYIPRFALNDFSRLISLSIPLLEG